ncbi:hypothetical protein Bbelb_206090 [Branchiostoma belcheri]|nr:hypothetical protein Bbelb_206090 [Branchiostoma belcheri]
MSRPIWRAITACVPRAAAYGHGNMPHVPRVMGGGAQLGLVTPRDFQETTRIPRSVTGTFLVTENKTRSRISENIMVTENNTRSWNSEERHRHKRELVFSGLLETSCH